MIPPIDLTLPHVASSIGIAILDAPKPPDLATAFQQFVGQFAAATIAVMASVNSAVVDIARAAYVTCLLVGVVLYFTRLGRRLGKDLMVGGVVLVVISEYLIPVVTAVTR
jgi:hypothetical protein